MHISCGKWKAIILWIVWPSIRTTSIQEPLVRRSINYTFELNVFIDRFCFFFVFYRGFKASYKSVLLAYYNFTSVNNTQVLLSIVYFIRLSPEHFKFSVALIALYFTFIFKFKRFIIILICAIRSANEKSILWIVRSSIRTRFISVSFVVVVVSFVWRTTTSGPIVESIV